MNSEYFNELKYTSVTLFYHYSGVNDASSGIYILDDEGKNSIISIIDVYIKDIKDLNIKYTCGELIHESNVKWINIPINEDNILIKEINCSDLEDFFTNCKNEDINRKKYILKIELPKFCTIRNELNEFEIFNNGKKIKLNKKRIRIESSPFGLSTVEIFNGYTNYGHVNYESKNYEFFLSDCKFMDNMNGGIVFVDGSNKTIGLIWGNIKWKGHGELMIILNWDIILNTMRMKKGEIDSEIEFKENDNNIEDEYENEELSWIESYKKVVGLKVLNKFGVVSWGSGIIIGKGMIVTNKHVITGNLMNNEIPKRIEIKYNEGDDIMKLIDIDEPELNRDILMPLEGRNDHDVCFLRIRKGLKDIKDAKGIKVIGGGYLKDFENKKDKVNIKIGEYSVSIGYGLFYDYEENKRDKIIRGDKPLQSFGNVSKIYGSNNEMIISSSSCWSGCSGGAIVNSQGELLGMMVSNVRHLDSGEVLERLNFSIGISVLSACYRTLVSSRSVYSGNQDLPVIVNARL
ncbi:hypothetical protein C6P40_004585 [Pichia californica]|uniref:Serine protease n=1 Tax=Pichia californica TaxID=460514 RepID=A0A9P6WME2_9ASCO|nr:hypothetical protein C6P42_003503 [[Candida] californica]KAG0689727.1 hypothetical protein C6P40_004585 [[Candida] californica]